MRRPLATVLLATLALAACGDDGLSAKEYRAEAKKICVASNRDTDAVEQPTKSTPEAIADYLKRLLAANEKTTKRFRALDPPDELRKPHEAILKANEDGTRTVRAVIADLESGADPRTVLQDAAGKLREYGRQVNDGAKRIGVAECRQ